ncbi:hypothetical protein ABPG75_013531 [Micractinium tetrahymenae]
MAEVAEQVAQRMRAAADALEAAAGAVPDCDCEHLDADKMSAVVGDLMRAQAAASVVHNCLRTLERRHCGAPVGLATLETQPLDGLPTPPAVPPKQAEESIAKLADEAGSELTGGQCC